jgi:hypothetical protein
LCFLSISLAPEDYTEILQVLSLDLESQNISVPVTIADDLALENMEVFTVNISSTDDFVAVGEDSTQVFISDSGM